MLFFFCVGFSRERLWGYLYTLFYYVSFYGVPRTWSRKISNGKSDGSTTPVTDCNSYSSNTKNNLFIFRIVVVLLSCSVPTWSENIALYFQRWFPLNTVCLRLLFNAYANRSLRENQIRVVSLKILKEIALLEKQKRTRNEKIHNICQCLQR